MAATPTSIPAQISIIFETCLPIELSFLFVIAMRLGVNFLSSFEDRLLISISIAAIVSAVSPD